MVELSPTQVKYAVYCIVVGVVAAVLGVKIWIFSYIAELITLPGAIGLAAVLICIMLRLVFAVMTFPGSFCLWRRTMEAYFCRELSRFILA